MAEYNSKLMSDEVRKKLSGVKGNFKEELDKQLDRINQTIDVIKMDDRARNIKLDEGHFIAK